jgi:tetratricopeptide (TPR) repeat protein
MRKISALIGAALAGIVMLPVSALADKARDLENACYDSKGNVAVSVCTSAIEAAPEHSNDEYIALNLIYAHRGDAYEDLGQYALAVKDYDQAIKLDPSDEAFYRDRGTAYFLVGEFARAIQDSDEEIRLHPDNADAYYCRGLTKKKMGDVADGDADIAKAKELDPYIENE